MNSSGPSLGAAQLAEARAAIAQGRLADALVHLDSVTATQPADSATAAAVELLRGNVWYERGSYAAARAHYERALGHFSDESEPGARGTAGEDAAAANLRMAEIGMVRQATRSSEAEALELTVGFVLLAAALCVARLAWLSRRSLQTASE